MGNLIPRHSTWRERKSIVYVVLIIVFVVVLTAVIVVLKLKTFNDDNVCTTKECVGTSSFLLSLLDPKADPCDNFYNFTCGNYRGKVLTRDLQHVVDQDIRSFITGQIQEDDSRSVKTQKKYYHTCMNVTAIEEDQNETLKKLLQKIGDWPVLEGDNWEEADFDWSKIVEKCKAAGFYYNWFINLKYYENKLDISPPDNVNQIESELKESYVGLMANVSKILGAPGNVSKISRSMENVMNFEIELSKIINQSRINASDAEYTIYDYIGGKFPSIPWFNLLRNAILPLKVKFEANGYIPKLERLLNATHKRVQADYIFWKLIESLSRFLTYEIRKKFQKYEHLSGSYKYPENREDFCFGITTAVFPCVSEAAFARRYASERKSVQEMVDRIKLALHDHIEKAEWMEQSDKDRAYFKLENMSVIIGGPDEMFNESAFDKFLGVDKIDLSGLSNSIEIILRVDTSIDHKQRKLPTAAVARFYRELDNLASIKYLTDKNIMFLPAAALDGVFFSQGRPKVLNYGAIGTIIGYELAHGILGSSVYEDDNKVTLWTNYTQRRFASAAECLLERCNDIGVEHNISINCTTTFEENFADYAGVTLSYDAFKNVQEEKELSLPALPYNSNQLFWIVYSSIMCSNMDTNNTENLTHMLKSQRIMGSIRNTEYFAKDFNCSVGSNMNPREKCRVL